MERKAPYVDENGLPLWAPRVSRKSIGELYRTDALGIRDPDLIDEVGIGLLARCESILTIASSMHGQFECPACLSTWSHEEGDITCDTCGWSISWEGFGATHKHRQLSAGGAAPFFKEFAEAFPRANTLGHKMVLIDTLIHRFHSELEKDESPTRPAAVNLIQGKMKDVILFLNRLSYSGSSTIGTRQTLSEWRDKWNNSYFMAAKQRSSPEDTGIEVLEDSEQPGCFGCSQSADGISQNLGRTL